MYLKKWSFAPFKSPLAVGLFKGSTKRSAFEDIACRNDNEGGQSSKSNQDSHRSARGSRKQVYHLKNVYCTHRLKVLLLSECSTQIDH